jgi:hypothetical protein
MKIFVFGNPLVKEDNMPLKLVGPLSKEFPGIEFREFDPNENMEELGTNPVIIDTVMGIDKVEIITDIDSIKNPPRVSAHDLDLGTNLKLLKGVGLIEGVNILGVPGNISGKEALKQLKEAIKNVL